MAIYKFKIPAIVLNDYGAIDINLFESYKDYCAIKHQSTSFYIFTSMLCIYSIFSLYYLIRLVTLKRNEEIRITFSIFLYPIITLLYFMLSLFEIFTLTKNSAISVVVTILSLSPGISYGIVFLIIVYKDKSKVESVSG